ncbi:MAG TPA: SemiSWEET transporter [Ferruginibacter sp.]|nr:SemiSWEET transporter [Ferruginibacter sp.]
MNVSMVTVIGIVASLGTAMSMVPQLTKLIKEKKADDISIYMLIVLFAGIGCWIAYGVLKGDWIIIISNSFSFLVNLALTILTLRYKVKN